MVTHDVDEALYLADRLILMTDGPSARVGETLSVPFPRPRDRMAVLEHPRYYEFHGRVIDFLENQPGPSTPAAWQNVPDEQPVVAVGH
jgi:ABC-type nitrate/sulfonate/bicarbonate transport system ATPase subunit